MSSKFKKREKKLNLKTLSLNLLFIPLILQAQSEEISTDDQFNNNPFRLETIQVYGSRLGQYPGNTINRTARVGVLGNTAFMNSAYNVTSFSPQAIKRQQSQTISDFLNQYDASINTTGGSSTASVETMTVRGFPTSISDMNINGLSGIAGMYRVQTNGIDRVEVLKGPSAMLNGTSLYGTVGGTVNLVTKKATDEPIMHLGLSYYSRSRLGINTDLASRFGENKQWGIRYNAKAIKGDSVREKQKESMTLNALSVDFRGENVRLSVDTMINDIHQKGARGSLYSALMNRGGMLMGGAASINGQLIDPPKGKNNIDQPWTSQNSQDRMIMSRIEVDLNDNLTAYGAIGYAHNKYTGLSTNYFFANKSIPGLGNFAQIGSYTDSGYGEASFVHKVFSSELGINGKWLLGPSVHNWSLSSSLSHRDEDIAFNNRQSIMMCMIRSTIYHITRCDEPEFANVGRKVNNKKKNYSFALADNISLFDDKFNLVLGLRHQNIRTENVNNKQLREKSALTPTVGVVFKPINQLSLYSNYSEGLTMGDTAPEIASNRGEVLAPYKTKQVELGVRKNFDTWLATASIYQIQKASGLLNPISNRFEANGKQRNRGVELALFGEPLAGLSLSTSIAWINAKRLAYDKTLLSGSDALAIPKFATKLNLEWAVPKVQNVSLIGSVNYTGKATLDGQDFYTGQLTPTKVPAWTRVDLGAKWSPKFLGKNTNIQANIENVFNKRYWTVSDTGGAYINHAQPRIFMLSLGVDF